MSNVIIIGGFASVKWFYKPLEWWLSEAGLRVEIVSPGPLTVNVWPLDVFLGLVAPKVRDADEPITIVGHSLGGIQAMLLAAMYPEKVKKIFALGSPVWGCPQTVYEEMICTLINVSKDDFALFQHDMIPLIAQKTTTIACMDDSIAPPEKCEIPGASNFIVEADKDNATASHLLLPYLHVTVEIVLREIHALESTHP